MAACRNGALVEDLTRIIGCGKTNFHRIRREYPAFRELLKNGREEADLAVEYALFKRATGFEYEEVTNEVKINPDGSTGQVVSVKKTKKMVPADTGAMAIWLKNRRSDRWKDKHEVDMTVNPFLQLMQAATGADNPDKPE